MSQSSIKTIAAARTALKKIIGNCGYVNVCLSSGEISEPGKRTEFEEWSAHVYLGFPHRKIAEAHVTGATSGANLVNAVRRAMREDFERKEKDRAWEAFKREGAKRLDAAPQSARLPQAKVGPPVRLLEGPRR